VIAIDGIRTVAPPETPTGRSCSLDATVGTLQVGSDLPFSLDENDPIFQQLQETVNQQHQKKKKKKPAASTSPTSTALSLDDEQAMLMDRLNADITAAEEEEDVMDDLDQEILEAEEKDLY
jgi:hypothetical protein